MFTRDITCQVCGKVLGQVSFPEDKTEEEWAYRTSGYVCEDDAGNIEAPVTVESTIEDLKQQISDLQTNQQALIDATGISVPIHPLNPKEGAN